LGKLALANIEAELEVLVPVPDLLALLLLLLLSLLDDEEAGSLPIVVSGSVCGGLSMGLLAGWLSVLQVGL